MPLWDKIKGAFSGGDSSSSREDVCDYCGVELLGKQQALDTVPSGPWMGSMGNMPGAVNKTGYQCTSCGSTFCMSCMESRAPPYPGGGKACPKCGGSIGYWKQ